MEQNFTVGQTLFFKDETTYSLETVVTVTKVGRRYITIDNQLKFEKKDSRMLCNTLDNSFFRGRCYLSKEEYLNFKRKEAFREVIRLKMEREDPSISFEDFKQILDILKVDISRPKT